MKYPVSKLDEGTRAGLRGHDLIVFDGVCVLCSGFFRFMQQRDLKERFSYAMAQADVGQALYGALGMPLDEFETNLVIMDGWIYTDLDAFAAAMGTLGWPWRGFAGVRWLPRGIKRPLYRLVARNRYRLFGRLETCLLPDAEVQRRFLPGGLV
ncbi:MAG: DCC1-like thiol-disulfide oxidoreductase family protein [Pseudomonadota bacterium]